MRRWAAALGALLVLPAPVAATAVAPGAVAGLQNVPWQRVSGDVGRWVRYRIGHPQLEATQYLSLAVVERDEKHDGAWVEMKVTTSPVSQAASFGARLLVARDGAGQMKTQRVIISFNGSAPVEVDLDTVLTDPADEEPLACTDPESEACAAGEAKGLRWRRLEPTTVLTTLGSLNVESIEVTSPEGKLYTYRVSEGVPVTGLVAADTIDGGRMELDGAGDGAVRTIGDPVRKVDHDQLASAIAGSTPALASLRRMGALVNPDEREEARAQLEDAAKRAAEAAEPAPESQP